MSRPLYVYVGTLLQTFGEKHTGIPRVESEIARRLIAEGATPFAFDERTNRFGSPADGLLEMAHRLQAVELSALIDESSSKGGQLSSRMIARAAAAAYPYMPHELGIHWHTERLA